jgi:hypothetical protein
MTDQSGERAALKGLTYRQKRRKSPMAPPEIERLAAMPDR